MAKAEIENLKKQIEELKIGWQRTQADFDNYRKRTENERKELILAANQNLLMEMLPILDNFSLALTHKPKELANNSYITGLEQIKSQLEQIFFSQGLEEIKTKPGDIFDPSLHEAISHEENEKYPEDQIIEVVQAGYKLGEKLLRPVKVRVSKGNNVKRT